MLRTGRSIWNRCATPRRLYRSEKVDDVTAIPPSAMPQHVAALYDMKADPANRDNLTYEEEGGRHSIYFLRRARATIWHGAWCASHDRRCHLRHVRPFAHHVARSSPAWR